MYGGGFAKELESWTDAAIVEDCLGVLKRMCGKEIPRPLDYCVTRWGKEQFSRMAFTYIPPGVDGHAQLAAAGEAIYDPILPMKPIIMFAGEHTTPYHPSTMHGAFLSGIREAYRYDIFVAPELNGNLKFETDHKIYEHTFPTKRVFKGPRMITNPKEIKMNGSSPRSQVRSRRHRFANMSLRKAPAKRVLLDTETIPSSPANKKSDLTTTETVGSRRSQRSLSTKKFVTIMAYPEKVESLAVKETEEQKKLLDELEHRSLSRALDSYGHDYVMAQSQILPVFGSNRQRTVEQIRQRLQRMNKAKRQTGTVWKQWESKVPVNVDSSSELKVIVQTGESGNTKRRRSIRGTKSQNFV